MHRKNGVWISARYRKLSEIVNFMAYLTKIEKAVVQADSES
ncbi:hypothetical protein [Bacillus halotolerans]|nr:hypothetical protein [Bacillus halotolerans]MEC1600703.1 hypothetical protein [Bacillus halotolerans]